MIYNIQYDIEYSIISLLWLITLISMMITWWALWYIFITYHLSFSQTNLPNNYYYSSHFINKEIKTQVTKSLAQDHRPRN